MARLNSISPERAEGETKELFDQVREKFGRVPNILQGMGASPVALGSYLALDDWISRGRLSLIEQDIVRLVTSEFNCCEYCTSVHSVTGKIAGLSEEQILDVRRGQVDDARLQALVDMTRSILQTRGFVSDRDIREFRQAGYDDGHLAEVLTIIAQKTLSNYFNHVNATELDFPKAPRLDKACPSMEELQKVELLDDSELVLL